MNKWIYISLGLLLSSCVKDVTDTIDRILALKAQTERERKEVWELGGLHVVDPHDARL